MTKYAMLKRDITLYYVVPPDIIEEKILLCEKTIVAVELHVAKWPVYILRYDIYATVVFVSEIDYLVEFLND